MDVYLWMVNKAMAGADLPDELLLFSQFLMRSARVDGISVDAMTQRLWAFERTLPQPHEISEDIRTLHETAAETHRHKVKALNLE